ncbi:TPA: P-loop NTPase fold protein [Serratia marcescens]
MNTVNEELLFETRDEYNRKPIAEKIIKILKSEMSISPMIIDGSWGTGKTEFCFKLINLFKEENQKQEIIYINAFNEDHTDEPILTLLAAIINLIPESERPSLIEKALPAIRFGVKTTLKAGAAWVLKQNTDNLAEEFTEAVQKTSDAAIDSTITSLIKDHVDSDKNIKALKTALTEISSKSPIYIFIDELDRCKPSFAISILENIKHVFDVENVKFILITNTQQLQASINHIYGISVDAKRYLDKFIKFSFLLPDTYSPDNHTQIHTSIDHWNYVSSHSELLKTLERPVIESIKELIRKSKLSLREVETFARYLEIYQSLSEDGLGKGKLFGYSLYRLIGVFFYCFNKEIALNLSGERVDLNSISSALKITQLNYNQRSYPDHLDLAFYGIISDSDSGKGDFLDPLHEQEQEQHWEKLLHNLFRYGHGKPNNVIKIVTSAIDVMQLK